jgi:7-carboxy-7-deazaguanine synthase
MFGKNPIRKPVSGNGDALEIVSIFATIQGEGPYAGWPAIFLRLGGCNLACSFCDTEFEDFRKMSLEEILSEVEKLHSYQKLVVITGGEPFRQPIEKLCQKLIGLDFKVQIETNGTLYRKVPDEVDIICSPKSEHVLRPDLLEKITAFKFIISASDPSYNHVPEVGQSNIQTPVYIQPMDEYDAGKNARNLEYTRDLALEHGYRLSLQLHKIIGVE